MASHFLNKLLSCFHFIPLKTTYVHLYYIRSVARSLKRFQDRTVFAYIQWNLLIFSTTIIFNEIITLCLTGANQ